MKGLIILGPTATGKTDIAIFLAKKLNGELVACDSRQVYKGLDIGSGKLPSTSSLRGVKRRGNLFLKKDRYWVIDGVKIWMYDVVDPALRYNVAQYIRDADACIKKIVNNKKLPIIVGGTGLYLKGLLEGFSNINIPADQKLRGGLDRYDLKTLQKKLHLLSPAVWENLNISEKNNKRRLIRQIEIILSGNQISKKTPPFVLGFDVIKVGLNAPRKILNDRIDARVLSRIKQGMIEEAEKLHENGLSMIRMRELGLEYGILADYLKRKIDEKNLIGIMQIKIHQYAKRQMTWFKKEKDIFWFDISEKDWQAKVEKLVLDWYNS